MSESNPSMRDVAAAAGVSRNAVSLAFRNSSQIPELTRQRIFLEADRIGYSWNPVVGEFMSHLKRRRFDSMLGTVALINAHKDPDAFTSHPTIPVYIRGCRSRALTLGYDVDEISIHDAGLSATRLADIFEARGIRGAVVLGLMDSNRVPPHLQRLMERIPVVVTGVRTRDPALHFASVDHHILVKEAISVSLDYGYLRPGLVMDPIIDNLVDGRFAGGFLLAQQGMRRAARVPIFWLDGHLMKQQEKFDRWMERYRPDVVLSLYNSTFHWMRRYADNHQSPRRGFIQLEWRESNPHIAGMNQHNDETGAAAIDLLVWLIHSGGKGVPAVPKATFIGPTWVDGKSLPNLKQPANC